ncbi:MAG: hypothetical protein JNL90_02655 [Planctomycetes bacterium]|nr:hypothetical protein [Planctomycetota bacterium]
MGGRPPDSSGATQSGALLEQLALHVVALLEKVGELASLGWKRLKLRAVDATFHMALVLAALAAGTTIVIAAALLLVRGIGHAIARIGGAEWIGELGGGLVALALPFAGLYLARARSRRVLLERALRRRPPASANASTNGAGNGAANAASNEGAPAAAAPIAATPAQAATAPVTAGRARPRRRKESPR